MVLESCDVQESGMLLPLSSLAIAQCTANFALSTHIRSFSVSQLVSYLSSLISLSLWVWRWWESPSWQREQRVHKSVCHLFYMESYKCNLKRSKSLTKTPRKWQKEWKLAIFILMTKYEEGIGKGGNVSSCAPHLMALSGLFLPWVHPHRHALAWSVLNKWPGTVWESSHATPTAHF